MKYSIECTQPIVLGMKGDTATKTIVFDLSDAMKKHPELVEWYIEALTPCEQYYAPKVDMRDQDLCWVVTTADTLCPGYGKYQIVAKGAAGEKKTFGWYTFIVRDKIASPDDVSCDCCKDPMTVEEATEAMVEMLGKAEAAASQAEEVIARMEECELCNGSGDLIFDGGDSDTNLFDEEEGQ